MRKSSMITLSAQLRIDGGMVRPSALIACAEQGFALISSYENVGGLNSIFEIASVTGQTPKEPQSTLEMGVV